MDFIMETWFYLDQPGNKDVFVQISNRGGISKGEFYMKDGVLWLEGKTYSDDQSVRRFKQSFELKESGELLDCFFRFSTEKWIQGHEIQYKIR